MKFCPIKSLTSMALVSALTAFNALAQTAKSVVAESVPAFTAFNQWISTVVIVQSEPAPGTIDNVPLALTSTATDVTYQPLPVILGLPELPLLGNGATQAARKWNPTLNYQGLYMQQVVLNAAGTKRTLRPMNTPVRHGDRFKIRITPTFDAVAEVDQVLGDAWYGKRTGQVYPQVGMSVQIKAGETVDLPLESNKYFLMNRPANERLVVSVRHPRALNGTRSSQPAYRQDANNGSSYLQLVPPGKFAAIEQLVSQSRGK